ncbi:putative F-box protein At5g52610 [Neltuma alba]|uniref:putative F-box protein At5g52610 n=1 Tax=Neltuma alba TaxID=207710 RepID=UPI0010A589C1|nr:putative F-box protein At5g52610 [Prosopis alba]
MDSDVLYLPQEIIRNILKRLPVKSLIRFQCVCKHWRDLIKNTSFIADHLQQSSHQKPYFLLKCNGSRSYSRWRLGLLDCGLQVRKVHRPPLINSSRDARILGSCNGLLCVEINLYNNSPPLFSLWNPATTAVRRVPRTRADGFQFDDSVTGFGFSPILNDYKIVITYAEVYDAVNRVEVFSLNGGSWRVIDIGNLKGVKLYSQTVTANGAVFWYGEKLGAEEGEDEVEVIVSFDIAKEVFALIPRPNLDYNADEKLTVYENKLAILCEIWENDDETADLIDLWVLDEGTCASGETWSWTRRYTSSPFSRALESMTMWRNEIICTPTSAEDNEEGRNVLYSMNITTNEVKRFVVPNFGPIRSIYDYAESLVSVGNS